MIASRTVPVIDAEHRRVVAKRDVLGEIVYVLHQTATERDLRLEPIYSRAVLLHDIHELIATRADVGPGDKADDVRYIGFFEVLQGGCLRVGDTVSIGDRVVGELAGFDLTHAPNHLNLVVRSDRAATGEELGIALGEQVRFSVGAPEARGAASAG